MFGDSVNPRVDPADATGLALAMLVHTLGGFVSNVRLTLLVHTLGGFVSNVSTYSRWFC